MEADFLSSSERGPWEEFWASCPDALLYQHPDFIDIFSFRAQRAGCIGFWDQGRLAALLPAGLIAEDGLTILTAPFSAGFGGFLLKPGLSIRKMLALLEAARQAAKRLGANAIRLITPPFIYQEQISDALDYALVASGFSEEPGELTAFLSCGKQIGAQARQNAKRALKEGLVFEADYDLAEIHGFIAEEKEKLKFSFNLPLAPLLELNRRIPQAIYGARLALKGATAAAIIGQRINQRASLGFAWAHDPEFSPMKPVDLLLAETARQAFAEGRQFWDMGTVTLGGKLVQGVARFKNKFDPDYALRRKFQIRL